MVLVLLGRILGRNGSDSQVLARGEDIKVLLEAWDCLRGIAAGYDFDLDRSRIERNEYLYTALQNLDCFVTKKIVDVNTDLGKRWYGVNPEGIYERCLDKREKLELENLFGDEGDSLRA